MKKKANSNQFEVLDGQQRVIAIGQFFCNEKFKTNREYTIEKIYANKNYSQLKGNKNLVKKLDDYVLYYIYVTRASDQEIADFFIRLQEGSELKGQEKLNALSGEMRDFIVTASRHGVFKNMTRISKKRFAHRLLCAQVAKIEEANLALVDHKELIFPSLRYPGLRTFYEAYKPKLPQGLNKRVMGALSFLHRSLKKEINQLITTKADFITVYLLASTLNSQYAGVNKDKNFRDFLIDFFSEINKLRSVAQKKAGPSKIVDPEFEEYASSIGKGLTQTNLLSRYKILSSRFFSKFTSIKPKDPLEKFDINQRFVIYYKKDKGVCGVCKQRKVKWAEAGFHHIKFRSHGGPTLISNGRLMHKKCHDKFHKKHGQDSGEQN